MELSQKLDRFKKELDILIIRFFIKKNLGKNYKNDLTYVIYDGNKVEVFDQEMHDLKRELKSFRSFLIVKSLKEQL